MGTHPIFESDFDCLTEKRPSRTRFDSTRDIRKMKVTVTLGMCVGRCREQRISLSGRKRPRRAAMRQVQAAGEPTCSWRVLLQNWTLQIWLHPRVARSDERR